MDQHTRLKSNLRKVHFNALFMLQASTARVNVTNYVLDLNTVSRSVLIPLGLDGALIRIKKRVQDVCAKSNVCFIAEEAESLKGAVGDKCRRRLTFAKKRSWRLPATGPKARPTMPSGNKIISNTRPWAWAFCLHCKKHAVVAHCILQRQAGTFCGKFRQRKRSTQAGRRSPFLHKQSA